VPNIGVEELFYVLLCLVVSKAGEPCLSHDPRQKAERIVELFPQPHSGPTEMSLTVEVYTADP